MYVVWVCKFDVSNIMEKYTSVIYFRICPCFIREIYDNKLLTMCIVTYVLHMEVCTCVALHVIMIYKAVGGVLSIK